jgi:hypothetical protein
MMQRFSIFAAVGILSFVLITLGSKSSTAMKSDLCSALASNDQNEIARVVNSFLETLPVKGDAQEKFDSIRNWLARHDCISSVTINDGVLDSYPSVKVFSIILKGSEKRTSVGVMMYEDQWKYDLK